ncbi:MAG: rod shape-determining protein MreD [Clostridiales bacterium]|nr:rod shape-determining protein MreD [Clostridiales bacterium]
MNYLIENKNTIIRRVIFVFILLAAAALQGTKGLFPTPGNIGVFLIIPAAVSIAMFEREVAGLLFGAFAGALWDTYVTGFGFNAMFLTIVTFGAGVLIHYLMRNNLSTAMLMCSLSMLLYILLYWLFNYVFKGYGTAMQVLLKYYLPTFLYSLVFIPVIYLMVRTVMKKFR